MIEGNILIDLDMLERHSQIATFADSGGVFIMALALVWGGFLPYKKGKRERELQAALDRDHTSLYFESPHRLVSTLEILTNINPLVRISITKELTKKFENIYGGQTLKLLERFNDRPPRGEFVLAIDPTSLSQ